MIFQNDDVAHLRNLATRRGHWHVSTTLRLIGVPFEDAYVILFGKEPRSRAWEGLTWLKHVTKDVPKVMKDERNDWVPGQHWASPLGGFAA